MKKLLEISPIQTVFSPSSRQSEESVQYFLEQQQLMTFIQDFFLGRSIVELGCGSGFWTFALARTARKVIGMDTNRSVMEVAAGRCHCFPYIHFQIGDERHIPDAVPRFTGAMANFLFSQVSSTELKDFLARIHKKLASQARVIFIDYTRQTDQQKNTYTEKELREIFAPYAPKTLEIFSLSHFWCVGYELAPSQEFVPSDDVTDSEEII
jgi:SAM-dependent methyltransferase